MRIEHAHLLGSSAGDLEFRCVPGFNLLIGRNGSGKSHLLRAISQTLRRWPTGLRLPLLGGRTESGASVVVHGVAPDGGKFFAREDRADFRHRRPTYAAFEGKEDARARALWEVIDRGAGAPLPLLAHATPDHRSPPHREQGPEGSPDSRLAGWRGAMNLRVEPDDEDWFKRPVGQFTPERLLEAIRPALIAGVPDLTNLKWQKSAAIPEPEIGGEPVPWRRLPDSYRAMIGLIGGLAWRAAVLDGSWHGDAAARVGGVVLLEEVERHLDLNWQRRVVEDLRRAFPRVQFIATTHSPFVVQSMRSEEVINLDDHAPMEFWREGIEDIAVEAMGVDEDVPRSRLYRELEAVATEYYQLLDSTASSSEQIAAKKARLDELEARFTDDPSMAAFLKMQRLARDGGK